MVLINTDGEKYQNNYTLGAYMWGNQLLLRFENKDVLKINIIKGTYKSDNFCLSSFEISH